MWDLCPYDRHDNDSDNHGNGGRRSLNVMLAWDDVTEIDDDSCNGSMVRVSTVIVKHSSSCTTRLSPYQLLPVLAQLTFTPTVRARVEDHERRARDPRSRCLVASPLNNFHVSQCTPRIGVQTTVSVFVIFGA